MRCLTYFPLLAVLLLSMTLLGDGPGSPYQFLSPMPGSENNTRESTIIIRHGDVIDPTCLSVGDLVTVRGSLSGTVAGDIVLSSDTRTVIFKPHGRFQPGETVTVTIGTGFRSSAGRALPRHDFSFRITEFAEMPNPLDYLPEAMDGVAPRRAAFRDIDPEALTGDMPAMTVTVHDSAAVADGYIFLAVAADVPGIGYYLMMLENDGTPFFARELMDDYAYDFKVQANGQLSYAQFLEHHSYTGGGNVIHMVMDNSFAIVDSFQMGNGYIAEAHDFEILPNGHALLIGYYLTRVDMSRIVPGGYPNALVSGGIIQELDADRNVVFQWRSWDHYDFATYPINSRFATRPIVSEFHLNTINLDRDGHIITATPRWVKKINRQTGEIIWRLGDFDNDFAFVGVDSATGIDYVGGHRFHRLANDNFLLYDNGNRQGTATSQVHEFTLDEQALTAELMWTWAPDTLISAWHRGNAERLPNGNTGIGWGGALGGDRIPAYTEVAPDGRKVYEINFDNPAVESYRAFRLPFPDGQPSADVTITEVAPGSSYDFVDGPDNDTGIRVRINSLGGSGYNELTVEQHDYAPGDPEFPGRAPRAFPSRMVMRQFNISSIDADVMFDVDDWAIRDPGAVIVYRREFEGQGLFIPLATTYNPATRKVIAATDRFGEFILTTPDLDAMVFSPWLIAPADSGTVNQELPVQFEWTPVGFAERYDLQVATDAGFTALVVDESGLSEAIYTLATVAPGTDYWWRARTTNAAGTSDWSAARRFTAVAPFVAVTSPDGGEEFQRGLEYFLEWTDNLAGEVVLELFRGTVPTAVIDTVESSGAFLWEVPFDLAVGSDYYLKVRGVDTGSPEDLSDAPFAIIDSVTAIGDVPAVPVNAFVLHPNYPNPFNPSTTVRFDLPVAVRTTLGVYNILGQRVALLVDGAMPAGRHAVTWDAGTRPSGVYFLRLEAGEYRTVRKVLLAR